jgi:hypothetical protein
VEATIGALVEAHDFIALVDAEIRSVDCPGYVDCRKDVPGQQKAMKSAVGAHVHSDYLALGVNARGGVLEEGTGTRRIKRGKGILFGAQKYMGLAISALVISRDPALGVDWPAISQDRAMRVN